MCILQRWPKGVTVVANSVKYPRKLVQGIMWRHHACRSLDFLSFKTATLKPSTIISLFPQPSFPW